MNNDVTYSFSEEQRHELALVMKDFVAFQDADILSLAKDSQQKVERITEKDVDAIMMDVKTRCAAAGVPDAKIREIYANLASNIGAPRSQMSEMQAQALLSAAAAISEAGEGKSDAKPETPAEGIARYFNEFKKYVEETSKNFSEMEKLGAIFNDDDKKHKTELEEKILASEKELKDMLARGASVEELNEFKKKINVMRGEHNELATRMTDDVQKQVDKGKIPPQNVAALEELHDKQEKLNKDTQAHDKLIIDMQKAREDAKSLEADNKAPVIGQTMNKSNDLILEDAPAFGMDKVSKIDLSDVKLAASLTNKKADSIDLTLGDLPTPSTGVKPLNSERIVG